MAGLLVAITYAVAALLVARYAYARMRAAEIEEDGLARYGMEARLFWGTMSYVVGIFWPLAALVLILTAKPRKSPTELRAEAKEREDYIRRLERELGMKESH